MKAELLVDAKCTLAEGIQWRPDQQRLWWTDIHGCALWSCDGEGADVVRTETPERLGSFAFDPDGHLLCALESGLFKWDLDRDRLERLTDFEPSHPTSRMNDGRCDRQGRFIAGGIDEDGLKPTSTLIRYAGREQETLHRAIGCSNSICFSPEGDWMYFADTPSRVIQRFPYDFETGAVGKNEDFFRLTEDCPGFPDGSCTDATGAIWNARFNGYGVQQILPDGTPGIWIDVPVPQVTCACFGGVDLDRLYITTARERMSDVDLAKHPVSGGIFVVEPGVTGLSEDRFSERLFPH
ncbi:MAG: SMP-30/gluconolactonase/LRE family protein [Pseudomonadota bacterium]